MLSILKKKYSLQVKLSISSSLIILIMVLLLVSSVYFTLSALQFDDAIQLNSEFVNAVGSNFDNSVESFKRQINFITMNSTMQARLNDDPQTEASRLIYFNLMRSSIINNTLALKELDGVYIYDKKETLITFWQKKYSPDDPFVILAKMNSDKFLSDGKITTIFENGRVIYNRTILDLKTLEKLGFASFIYDEAELKKVINSTTQGSERLLILIDQNNRIIMPSTNAETFLEAGGKNVNLNKIPNNTCINIKGTGDVLVSRYLSKNTDFSLICIVSKNHLMRSADFAVILIICFGILTVLFGALFQITIAKRIVSPLNLMTEKMYGIEMGNYEKLCVVETGDEIETLAHSFNNMIDKIDVLINQSLRDEIKYKDMQLMALHSQINPHFLYNMLECINSLAQLERKDEVRQITLAFSRLMKSMMNGPKMVKLKDELNITNDFLTIYKIFSCNKLNYDISADEEFENFEIPRLIIQPLVENSFLHGIKPSGKKGHINITVSESYEGILISIMDDGVGMPPHKAKALQQYIDGFKIEENAKQIGLGTKNVIDRLKIMYAERVSISLQSSSDFGTIIDININLDKEAECEK